MNRIAFIFTHGPHGHATGREGLDALLAISSIGKEIGVFFIADGVLLLLPGQQPAKILGRDFIATFGILRLYDINYVSLCANSVLERGLNSSTEWILPTDLLSSTILRQRLDIYDVILTF